MKLATWNVNSLSVRLPQVLDWLAQNPVDVLCLQELKLTEDKFPFDALKAAGYYSAVLGQKTYNGVAILSRTSGEDLVKNIPDFVDEQARVIAITINTATGPLRLVNGYFVNGQAPGSEKFEYKMRWLDALHKWLEIELKKHPKLALLGDFNITPDDRDSYDPQGLHEAIHHTSEERAHFRALLNLGLTDTFRHFEQAEKSFSWWDYREFGFKRNRGLRIDHILTSAALTPFLKGCAIDKTPRRNERPSDHTPVIVELFE